jgi:mRNA-degrading endonuclease YafQ of YafQ-DinJ toxin-antitoxin module
VKRELLRSNAFIRAAKKFVQRPPEAGLDIASALQLLSDDAYLPKLKTYKLKGVLEGFRACSAGMI